jgi:hypothetical protein
MPEFSSESRAPGTYGDAATEPVRPEKTWFRTREGRRYAWEIALIVAVKLALLLILWFAIIKPWPHPTATPSTVVRQLYAPMSPPAHHD